MTRAVGQSGRLSVQYIEHHRDQNRDRGYYVISIEHGQDRKDTTEQIACRKQIGNQMHSVSLFCSLSHRLTQPGSFHRSSPKIVSPPFTRSPTVTLTSVPSGTKVSIREPNRMSPNRSPRIT